MISRKRKSRLVIKKEECRSSRVIHNSTREPSSMISPCWDFTSLFCRSSQTYCRSACLTTTKPMSVVLLMLPAGADFTTVMELYTKNIILLLKKIITQFIFLLLVIVFNKKYLLDNSLIIYILIIYINLRKVYYHVSSQEYRNSWPKKVTDV